ncbi:MAG TPA: response regulator transcription factor [Flavipsychrobacter sp.]|nr:response regulator transcription factor [Flavipsychrobacter sp.]
MNIFIAIAEDNSFALRSCLDKLKAYDSVKVLSTSVNGILLLENVEKNIPDVVLMDIQMPLMDGIECTRELKKKHPQVKVLMLTTFDDDEKIFEAIMAGASGYILKEEPAEQLYKAIEETKQGGAAMSAGIALKVLNLLRNPLLKNEHGEKVDFDITKREREILEQLKTGLSYEQIATNLFISYGTVRKHIENIYRKLQVNNKVEAVQKALQNRIIN